ncbi:MAG: molybdopterin-dependent oxidoreductase [Gammaproteobacteria bacterium]|nr:molybdopterin-dependent oxidoreductase [Gammaproteobacteria bacterium]
MDKRQFLMLSAGGVAALPFLASASAIDAASRGPALLTVSGAIGRGNRGALDPALDQMMHKQNVQFDRAYTFDFAGISALPAVTIAPTLEYDLKQHALRGPLLSDIVAAVHAPAAAHQLLLRAVDGYAVVITLADAHKYRFIVATHLDGKPMPLGGLGPLWAVYDADRFAEMSAKPVNQRFGLCPWALYHIEVQRV